MEHCGYVVKVEYLRPHTNADRLQIATFFGNGTCVGLDVALGDVGIYFPSDLQLSEEFCDANHMCRKKIDGTADSGYLERDKRNVKAIKLRGEMSDGIFCALSSVEYTGIDISTLNVGDTVSILNGHEICRKYIPRKTSIQSVPKERGFKTKSIKINLPYFQEHIDTPQLRFCQDTFKEGDYICLTEKVHGTSSRNANTLQISYRRSICDKIFHRVGREVKQYKEVVGTRRTVVKESDSGFYGTNKFRIDWADKFKGKLREGEEVFGEIAGFYDKNLPIMSRGDNTKTKDKAFIRIYGNTTTFSYGCDEEKGESQYFIYRMTYTSPEGFVFEYPWDYVKVRAEQMGFEVVPELERFIYTTQEDFMARIDKYMDIPSTIDSKHIIEGVVVRTLNAPNSFRVAKEKSFNFKVIESIIKDVEEKPDMEEAEELVND